MKRIYAAKKRYLVSPVYTSEEFSDMRCSLHFYSKSKRYFGPSFHLYKQFVDLRHIFGEKKCSFGLLAH